MQLRRARISNFKIVEDSNEFTVDRLTCLVGKNESGKTAILRALYRLNPYEAAAAGYDKVEEYPRRHLLEYEERHPDGEACVVSTTWELEESEVTAIEKVLGPRTLTSREVQVYKTYGDKATAWMISVDEAKIVDNILEGAGFYPEEAERTSRYKTVADLQKHLYAKTAAGAGSERENKAIEKIHSFRDHDPRKAAVSALSLPTFLYFSDFDVMKGTVALEDLLERKTADPSQLTAGENVFLAFLGLVGTSLEEINAMERFEPLKARLEVASNKITREMFEYWSQNRSLRVLFSLDAAQAGDPPPLNRGKILHTRIFNPSHEVSVNFDERSRGFVWFFSFLVLFSQVRKNYGKNVVILLDEPGLSLHPKAQADLLRYIEAKLKRDYQVIYTTHSPFMLDSKGLAHVRTVEDVTVEEEGRVEVLGSKVKEFVGTTDRDTLFPLQSALGCEISKRLQAAEHTLLVGSASDLLYLTGFSEALKNRGRTHMGPRWTICPVGGITNVAAFASLFGSNGHTAVLINSAGDQKSTLDLSEAKLLLDSNVLTLPIYTGKIEADVEDMIGWRNYLALVNKAYSLVGTIELRDEEQAQERVTKIVTERFHTMPAGIPGFSRYTVSEYFIQRREAVCSALPDLPYALDRFEKIFVDLNHMLQGSNAGSLPAASSRNVA